MIITYLQLAGRRS